MATKKSTAVAATKKKSNLPAGLMADLEGDAGMGTEGVTAEDMLIPFLAILQALSPQVDKRDSDYVDGAEPSMIYNSALQTLYDGEDGIQIIPVKYRKVHNEWVPRSAGGGYVGERDATIMDETERDEKSGRDVLPNGNEVVGSGDWYVLVLNPDGTQDQAVISFSMTQMKKSRRMMTMIKSVALKNQAGATFGPPMFYNVFKLTTVPEENDKGKWFGWDIEPNGNVFDLDNGEELYESAKGLYMAVAAGTVKAAPPANEPGPNSGGTPPAGEESTLDDDVPF
jgi:hypothetical protein